MADLLAGLGTFFLLMHCSYTHGKETAREELYRDIIKTECSHGGTIRYKK